MPACVIIAVTFLCPSSCHIAYVSPVSLLSHRLMGRHVFLVVSVILVRGVCDSLPSLSCYLPHGMSYGMSACYLSSRRADWRSLTVSGRLFAFA